MPWAVNQLRLTAFPTPSAVIKTPDWWAQVAGQPPDRTTNNAKQGVFDAAGTFADGTLALRVQLARIDWLYMPSVPEGMPPGIAPVGETVGPLDTAVDQFAPVIERWFELDDSPD